MKMTSALLIALLLTTGILSAQDNTQKDLPISVGDEIKESLLSNSKHSYTINLEAEHYVFGRVNQETVDVVVTILNPEGEKAAEFDGPARGWETFQFNTKAAGTYQIVVTPFEEEEGGYTISLHKAEPIAKDPAGKVDQWMTDYTGDVPGAAAMVIKDGDVIFHKAYGKANLAFDVPMTDQTLHNIGSTSKQFLTFGLLLLQEQGELSLEDDVRKYIPELPEFEHTVTLRHIVNHTSGYREFLNTMALTGRNTSSDLSQEKVIEIVQRQPELQNVPGTEFNYNNTGYVLATEVMERVTETPFPEWMEEHVFKPIGMNHTVVRSSPKQVVENRSTGYSMGESGRYIQETDLGGAMGAGGIHSTMEDLAKWIDNLLNPAVGTPEMIKEMTTPFTLANGASTQYGLGLFIQEFRGLNYFHHGGADVAHRSMLMVFPEINGAIVTQSNNAGFNGSISAQVAEAFFTEYMEQQEPVSEQEVEDVESPEEFAYDAANFEPLTGRYELSIMPGFILTFSRDGGRIYAQATGQPEINISATTDSTFTLVGVPASVTFHRNQDGTADSLTLHQNGNHIARKIAFELSLEDLEEYTGRYFSDEIETLYTLAIEDSSLVIKNYQFDEPLKLSAGSTDSFSGGFPIAEITFERDEEGNITGLKASNGRTRDVFFTKWD